jgi:hypothetical protein
MKTGSWEIAGSAQSVGKGDLRNRVLSPVKRAACGPQPNNTQAFVQSVVSSSLDIGCEALSLLLTQCCFKDHQPLIGFEQSTRGKLVILLQRPDLVGFGFQIFSKPLCEVIGALGAVID